MSPAVLDYPAYCDLSPSLPPSLSILMSETLKYGGIHCIKAMPVLNAFRSFSYTCNHICNSVWDPRHPSRRPCIMYVPCPISLSSLHVDCCIQKNGAVACQMDLLKGPVWSMDCMHLMCIHGCFRKALSTDTHTELVPICLIISIIVYGILFGEKYLKIVYFISPQTIMAAETSMPEAYSL